MMELIIVAGVAVGLGALATFLLATQIPEQLLLAGQNHGRYAVLGEGNYASHTAPSERRQIFDDCTHKKSGHDVVP